EPGAAMFAGFLLALAVYTLGYSFELASLNLPTMLFWNRIEYLGILTFPALYLVFVIQYTGHARWLTPRALVLLFAVPTAVLALKLTDGLHHLVYATVRVNETSPIPLLVFTAGPGYWVYAVFNSLCILSGIGLLWRQRRHVLPVYQREIHFMLGIATIPMLVYVFYLAGFHPIPAMQGLDYNPFVYTLWGAGAAWGMFQFRVFDLTPLAREVLIESIRDGVVVVDGYHRIADANPAGRRIFGWKDGHSWDDIRKVVPGLPEITDPSLGDHIAFETRLESEGAVHYYDIDISPLKDGTRELVGHLIVLHEITRRKQVEQQLQQARDAAETANARLREAWCELEMIAATDKLTGVFNRRKFDEYILREIDRANRFETPLSLAILDIDHFKEVNDQLGHDTGDRVLIEMAQVVSASLRKLDLVIRWGGDEFILLTPGVTLELAAVIAERIRETVAGHEFFSSLGITVSIGTAQYAAPETYEMLIKRADQALYLAKRFGRDRVETAPLEAVPQISIPAA
ncbi:MAG TPA: histidine kinase N-terminal 7TM domain-containing protein, partial [Anaerolineaceae bacterium]